MPTEYRTFQWDRRLPAGVSLLMIADTVRHYASNSTQITHPFWALDYTFTTTSLYKVGDSRQDWHNRKKCSAHLYPPETPYWERRPYPAQPSRSAYICFWQGEDAGLDKLIKSPTVFARFEDPGIKIGTLLKKGFQLTQDMGEESFWQIQAILFEIIGILMSANHVENELYLVNEKNYAEEKNGELSSEVKKFLSERMHEKVTLDQIADELNISRSTLTHTYGTETGEGPLATHMKMRIESVKQQLLLGEPLKAIAPRFGFSDIYHLSKAFKKTSGLSPREFLKSVKP